MRRTPTYMGPNEYDASKERRALNHLLRGLAERKLQGTGPGGGASWHVS